MCIVVDVADFLAVTGDLIRKHVSSGVKFAAGITEKRSFT